MVSSFREKTKKSEDDMLLKPICLNVPQCRKEYGSVWCFIRPVAWTVTEELLKIQLYLAPCDSTGL